MVLAREMPRTSITTFSANFEKRMAGNFEAISEFQKAIGAFRPDANSFLWSKNLHAESPCLSHGAAGEIIAAQPRRKTEIVLNAGAEPGLTAGRFTFDHHRVQAFAGTINGGSEPRRATTNNGEVVEAGLRVRAQADLVSNGGQRRFGKARAIGEKNQGKRFRFWPERGD